MHSNLNGLLGLILDSELLCFVVQDLLGYAAGLFAGTVQQGPQLLGEQMQEPASAHCTSATFTQAAGIPTLSSYIQPCGLHAYSRTHMKQDACIQHLRLQSAAILHVFTYHDW